MSFKTLLEPVIDSGIKNTNYFEGRVLTGQDLSEQEIANRQHRQQLGKTLGHGVVEGLSVTIENNGASGKSPLVRVHKGMAITLDGDVVELPLEYIDIELSRAADTFEFDETGFKNCGPTSSETLVPSGAGLYILVMSPANEYQEYAPKSGLQNNGVARNCGRAYWVEGVQFRLIKFDPTLMEGVSEATRTALSNQWLSISNPVTLSDLEGLSTMRNLVAHICFGTEAIIKTSENPNSAVSDTTSIGLDTLLGLDEGLTNCDTPLALIYWNLEGIAFIDNWAVKRKASHRDILPYKIPSFNRTSYARAEESRLQFQEQLTFLQDELTNLEDFSIKEYFRYLPPMGYLPIQTENNTASIGFDVDKFFEDVTVRESAFIEAAALTAISQTALTYWPIDIESGEFLWLYRTRENAQQADEQPSTNLQEYAVFTSGHVPYFALPRFDLSKWNYSNYISNLTGP